MHTGDTSTNAIPLIFVDQLQETIRGSNPEENSGKRTQDNLVTVELAPPINCHINCCGGVAESALFFTERETVLHLSLDLELRDFPNQCIL